MIWNRQKVKMKFTNIRSRKSFRQLKYRFRTSSVIFPKQESLCHKVIKSYFYYEIEYGHWSKRKRMKYNVHLLWNVFTGSAHFPIITVFLCVIKTVWVLFCCVIFAHMNVYEMKMTLNKSFTTWISKMMHLDETLKIQDSWVWFLVCRSHWNDFFGSLSIV